MLRLLLIRKHSRSRNYWNRVHFITLFGHVETLAQLGKTILPSRLSWAACVDQLHYIPARVLFGYPATPRRVEYSHEAFRYLAQLLPLLPHWYASAGGRHLRELATARLGYSARIHQNIQV